MKICPKCEKEMPIEQFAWKNKKSGTRSAYCKECHKDYSKEHYQKYRDKYREKAKIVNKSFKSWYRDLKSNYSCSKCGESHPSCIQFHHLDPENKEMEVSKAAKTGSKERVLREIEKCIPICANCHFKLHWEEYGV